MLLTMLISVSFLPLSIHVSAEEPAYGDVNCDGRIGLVDAICLDRYLCGILDLADLRNADVNKNGIISVADASILSDYMLGSVPQLPYRGN